MSEDDLSVQRFFNVLGAVYKQAGWFWKAVSEAVAEVNEKAAEMDKLLDEIIEEHQDSFSATAMSRLKDVRKKNYFLKHESRGKGKGERKTKPKKKCDKSDDIPLMELPEANRDHIVKYHDSALRKFLRQGTIPPDLLRTEVILSAADTPIKAELMMIFFVKAMQKRGYVAWYSPEAYGTDHEEGPAWEDRFYKPRQNSAFTEFSLHFAWSSLARDGLPPTVEDKEVDPIVEEIQLVQPHADFERHDQINHDLYKFGKSAERILRDCEFPPDQREHYSSLVQRANEARRMLNERAYNADNPHHPYGSKKESPEDVIFYIVHRLLKEAVEESAEYSRNDDYPHGISLMERARYAKFHPPIPTNLDDNLQTSEHPKDVFDALERTIEKAEKRLHEPPRIRSADAHKRVPRVEETSRDR